MFMIDIIIFWNGPYSSNYCYYALYFPNFFFGTTKIFKFQSYYLNSHPLKEIIIITKNYHIITIDITQTIDSVLNPKLSLPVLK